MRRTALLLLLFAACASPTAVIDKRSFRCGPGQDIEIRAGIIDPAATREAAGPVMYLVEIANNSHHDVTVKSVRLAPRGERVAGAQTVYREFNQLIPEGQDHLFELPASDAWVRSSDFGSTLAGRRLEFSATVSLTNGDSYHCDFAAQ
jgi:hypothetical protein